MKVKRNLDWGLLIATKDRTQDLEVCILAALQQTRPPKEIIVVDAGNNRQESESRLRNLISSYEVDATFSYFPADIPSLTVQRNQALDKSSADIVFMIDDDSFMHSNCAEEVMKIYEADVTGAIAGVEVSNSDLPPKAVEIKSEKKSTGMKNKSGKRFRVHPLNPIYRKILLMGSRELFIPYFGDYPKKHIPHEVTALDINRAILFHGARMTYRRDLISKSRFDPILRYYCPIEDLDASYRVSSYGSLVTAQKAKLYHHTSAAGRLHRRRVSELSALNQAVLIHRHATDFSSARRAYWRLHARSVLAEMLKDALSRRFDFPQLRGKLVAIPQVRKIFSMTPSELESWYPGRQAEIATNRRREVSPATGE